MKIEQEWIEKAAKVIMPEIITEMIRPENNELARQAIARAALSAVAPLIRAQALEEAAKVARDGWMVPPDGGSPTQAETDLCDEIERRISALIEPRSGTGESK